MIKRLLLISALLGSAVPAFAQQTPFNGVGSVSRSVTTVSARVALASSTQPTAMVCNTGSSTAYVKFGDDTITATTSDTPVTAGICIGLSPNGGTNIAAITASSTATLLIASGTGSVNGFGGGSGGGGGAVTVADGADVAEGTTTDSACAGDATSGCTLLSRVSRVAARLTTSIASLADILTAINSSIPAGTNRIGYQSDDPCTNKTKVNLPISQNGTSSVELKALSGSTVIYVCSLFLLTNSTATTVAITTGTGTACATGNAAVVGSTTANIANSMNLLAGAGFTLGGGHGTVARGAAAGALCMILGANVFVSGNLTYVQE